MVGTRLLLRCLPDTTGRRSTMMWLTGYVNFIVMHYDDQTYHIHNNPVEEDGVEVDPHPVVVYVPPVQQQSGTNDCNSVCCAPVVRRQIGSS